MNKILDDGRTVVSDSYAPFGQAPMLAEQPAKTEADFVAEAHNDKQTRSDLRRMTGWTDAQIDTAQGEYGFPKAIGRRISGVPGDMSAGEPLYSLRQIVRWHEAFSAFAAIVPRRLKIRGA